MNNSINKNKIAAVVPFYNEAETITQLVHNLKSYVDIIIAVDDGSTDNYSLNEQEYEKLLLIKNTRNKGKGSALNLGFRKSIELNSEVTFTVDADLQHDPKFIPQFISKMIDNDILIGNRLTDIRSMPLQRRLSNYITSKLLSIKTGQNIIDSQCGYRCYRTNILDEILPKSNGFEAETEILINASANNYKIEFTKISTIYNRRKSKMKALPAIYGFLRVLFTANMSS
ncbi:MAG: glycosyltransferase family 2 protein [Melioribacteraceae bacterium]|nr:glycosyltransferase family 2 protein [Melioribacteraceae bacterium]MCF8352888.1 glycosyltransferase family 2 protein [Melioribacteraceae bacterium]MCF8393795.1 glycosyltransferase family 2 protein [Melioribacteraceae bacterium]MCF8417405.1 glycosyltransferase family 2 protein [Melioribacteraceae bacterium]